MINNGVNINVLLVDDNKLIRDGIKSILKETKKIRVLEEAENGIEAVAIAEMNDFDVIVMDVKMPEMDGIEATKHIVKKKPNTKILAYSLYNESQYIEEILRAGAMGYILKNKGREELITAIKSVYEGNSYFSQKVSTKMMGRFIGDKSHKVSKTKVTRRENEVLQLIIDGFFNKQIAEQLFLSIRTIDAHRRNLLQKLDVKNTAGLVKYAYQKGLIEVD